MFYFAMKAALSGLLAALVSDIAKRSPAFGALVASLPLISIMAVIWLWRDTGDNARIAAHMEATFWYVIPMLAIDLQHLRYAVAAADYGSFRQAAEALLLQQSTLSRCIRQLEHAIGMTIFDRSNGGVQATPAGRDFLRMARSILDQMDTLVVSAYSTGRGEAGRLVIGFYTSLSAGNLRASLIEYAQRFPQITIGMIESSRIRLVTALQN